MNKNFGDDTLNPVLCASVCTMFRTGYTPSFQIRIHDLQVSNQIDAHGVACSPTTLLMHVLHGNTTSCCTCICITQTCLYSVIMIPELNDMLHVSYKHICTVPADQGCAFQRWIEMKFAGVTRKSFLTLMILVHVGRRVCGRGGVTRVHTGLS